MHHALVFSTSKVNSGPNPGSNPGPISGQPTDTAAWLLGLAPQIQHFISDVSSQPDARHIPARWLQDGFAAEIICTTSSIFNAHMALENAAFRALRTAASSVHMDVNIVPLDGRRKQLLIADMDSTIITSESLDDLAEMAGFGDAVAAITSRAMAGEIDFEQALDARIAMLAQQPSALFDRLINAAQLTDGAVKAVQTMRDHGASCYLISGGFDFMTGPIANICGFHGHHANHMKIAHGKITGIVEKPVIDRNAKAKYLAHYCKKHGIDASAAATIGDGANDLGMLQAAGMGVAFNGKPLLRDNIALQLNHTDLRGLLYLQGYSLA